MSKNTKATEEQSRKFIRAARELGCDESEEAFAEKLRKVAKAPAEPRSAKPSKERLKPASGCD